MWTWKGYPIFVSDKPAKKYYAVVPGILRPRRVYFGQRGYEHYWDRLGHYERDNHLDPVRRRHFKARHEKNRHKKSTAAWFADQILW